METDKKICMLKGNPAREQLHRLYGVGNDKTNHRQAHLYHQLTKIKHSTTAT